MNDTDLLFNPAYPLSKHDFDPIQLHKVIFVSIVNLAKNGVKVVQPIEIENFCKSFPAQMEVLNDGNYMEFIDTVKDLPEGCNYEYYHTIVRKFALLRKLKDQGFDITDYYDELGDENEEQRKLDKLSIQDILNSVESKAVKLRGEFDVNYVRDEINIGEDIDELLEGFKECPSFGAMLSSPLLTTLVHGFSRGNLFMRSAPSGCNKTRIAVADMCGLCVDSAWDYDKKDFVKNPNFQGNGLFIHTELDTKTEMQPMFLAAISGVPTSTITMGRCTHEEELRVKKAAEILLRNQFVLTSMPDFTSRSLERKIKESVTNCGSVFACFDYMMLNSPLSMEYKANTGVQAREDMALRGLATDLKDYCEKYNIGILTMTQTNGNEKTSDFPDESCIAGSRAMRNKVDAGFVMLPAKDRPKEMKMIEPFLRKKGFGNQQENMPNRITYLYKARFGEYSDQKIKIFHRFDPATMRNTDFLCCDGNNQFINIPRPVFE